MFTFRLIRASDSLRRTLRAAVAAHRPALLRELHASHGEAAFAAALADCSGRVIADALSMLPSTERGAVLLRLSKDALARYQRAGGPVVGGPVPAFLPRLSQQGLLVWGGQ